MPKSVAFDGNCRTTAMGILPHRDVSRALELSLSLDIPFWPQLPNVTYHEDMYAQASEHFPGITLDTENKRISFNSAKFATELVDYSQKMARPSFFSLSPEYSVVYHRFLDEDLGHFVAIRGQVIGPVSYGFKVMDENNMPIIYNEEVRALLFDFLQRKANAQYHELEKKNPNAFVWLDEPGLGWVFSGLSGYSDVRARQDYLDFMDGLDGPGALHLCASVNLPYLLSLGVSILSFDAYQMELMPKGYVPAISDYIRSGGNIAWGLVPTDSDTLETETPESLAERLLGYWEVVAENADMSVEQVAKRSLVAPARCCLKNIGQVGASDETLTSAPEVTADLTAEERVVERAFDYLSDISRFIRRKLKL